MKKIIYKFFLISFFTCLCFFGIDKVYAIDNGSSTWYVSNPYTLINNNAVSHEFYLSFSAQNLTIRTTGTIYYNGSMDGDTIPLYLWQRDTYCVSGNFSTASSTINNLRVGVHYSNIRCYFPNSSYMGHLIFVNHKVQLTNTQVGSNSIDNTYTLYQDGTSISLFGQQFSTIPFSEDYSSDNTLILQNDEILNELKAIKDSSGNIAYKVDQANTSINKNTQVLKETQDTLKDDDTSEASGEAESFFSGFSTDTHGLTSIITAPLQLIGSITSSTCSPLKLDVPFVEGKKLELPCMSSIYKKHFGSFLTIYQVATFGLIAYWVCVRIFALVKDFKDPDKDEVEVMDL